MRSLLERIKILFFNFIWRLIVILFEVFRMLLMICLYPIMICSHKVFMKLYPLFTKDLTPKNK